MSSDDPKDNNSGMADPRAGYSKLQISKDDYVKMNRRLRKIVDFVKAVQNAWEYL